MLLRVSCHSPGFSLSDQDQDAEDPGDPTPAEVGKEGQKRSKFNPMGSTDEVPHSGAGDEKPEPEPNLLGGGDF